MPRKRKTAKKSKTVISDNLRAFLLTGERPAGDAETFRLAGNWDRLKRVWEAVSKEIVKEFVKLHLCRRPWCWWAFEIKELRKRIGGIGDLMHEIGFYEPTDCPHGIPMDWVAKWQVEYYNGRFKDIHGNVVDSGFKEGDFKEVAIDPNNPPIYESESVYLRRLDLLSDTEKRHLEKHAELLEPEMVVFEEDD